MQESYYDLPTCYRCEHPVDIDKNGIVFHSKCLADYVAAVIQVCELVKDTKS